MELTVCCADVGSVAAGNFGWALRDYPHPMIEVAAEASIEDFSDSISERIERGHHVALGFECPLFVPIRNDANRLTQARTGEGNRPWSAGAGCGSLATGLVQAIWILRRIRDSARRPVEATLSWSEFATGSSQVFLWEALVTRKAKVDTHHGDAGVAVEAFCDSLPDPTTANAVSDDMVLSLIGAAALRSGLSDRPDILREPCLVLAA